MKKHDTLTDNPPIRIYVNEIKKRIKFRIKKGSYHEILTPETMKLLGSTKNKITTDENSENVPHLQITEIVLVLCNIVNSDYHQEFCIDLFPINRFVSY